MPLPLLLVVLTLLVLLLLLLVVLLCWSVGACRLCLLLCSRQLRRRNVQQLPGLRQLQARRRLLLRTYVQPLGLRGCSLAVRLLPRLCLLLCLLHLVSWCACLLPARSRLGLLRPCVGGPGTRFCDRRQRRAPRQGARVPVAQLRQHLLGRVGRLRGAAASSDGDIQEVPQGVYLVPQDDSFPPQPRPITGWPANLNVNLTDGNLKEVRIVSVGNGTGGHCAAAASGFTATDCC